MFHGRSANEVGLASAAVVLSLIQRLEKKGTLKREDALALLGDAADRLVATPRDTTNIHAGRRRPHSPRISDEDLEVEALNMLRVAAIALAAQRFNRLGA